MANRHNLFPMIADLRNIRISRHPSLGVGSAGRLKMAGNGQGMGGRPQNGTALATRTRTARKRPDLYRVLLLNDDYTPMEFVIHVLMKFFNKNEEEATLIMLHVHHHGVGECGTFTFEVAETKVTQVMDFARSKQHPLQCVMEKK
jgi:ATP-dependent Clp protease adaptor protein ClpS